MLHPRALETALDKARVAYVTDFNNHKIRRVVLATGAVDSIASHVLRAWARQPFPGTAPAAPMAGDPAGIEYDPTADVAYVADRYGNSIRRVDVSTGDVTTVGAARSVRHGSWMVLAMLRVSNFHLVWS